MMSTCFSIRFLHNHFILILSRCYFITRAVKHKTTLTGGFMFKILAEKSITI